MDLWVTLTVVASSVLLLLLLLSTAIVVSVRWTNSMRDRQTQVLTNQLQSQVETVQNLMDRLMSKDAITYSTLAAQTNSSVYPNEDHLGLTPVGTDQAELNRYNAQFPGQGLDSDDADIGEYLLN